MVWTERRYEGMLSNMFLDFAGEEFWAKVSREIKEKSSYALVDLPDSPLIAQRPP
jgi:hypothetical protein